MGWFTHQKIYNTVRIVVLSCSFNKVMGRKLGFSPAPFCVYCTIEETPTLLYLSNKHNYF